MHLPNDFLHPHQWQTQHARVAGESSATGDVSRVHSPPAARALRMLENGAAGIRCSSITRGHGLRLHPTAQQGLIDCAMKSLRLRDVAGIPWKPKMHMMVHIVLFSCGSRESTTHRHVGG